jgi:hypothetical protein
MFAAILIGHVCYSRTLPLQGYAGWYQWEYGSAGVDTDYFDRKTCQYGPPTTPLNTPIQHETPLETSISCETPTTLETPTGTPIESKIETMSEIISETALQTPPETLTETPSQNSLSTSADLDVSTDDEHDVELTEDVVDSAEYSDVAAPKQKIPLIPLVPIVVAAVVIAAVASVVITRKLRRREITHRGESSWSASLDDSHGSIGFVANFELQS